jgi:DNA-binding CsgD family transcriptional regulator
MQGSGSNRINSGQRERWFIILLLGGIFLFVVSDLLSDPREELIGVHLFVELGIGLLSFLGIVFFYVVLAKARLDLVDTQSTLSDRSRRLDTVQNQLDEAHVALQESHSQREKIASEVLAWKEEANKYILGLSESIDRQLERWGLTPAEKEVALLLLKGLGLKEIASIRGVTDKTIRAQATTIYSKSGLAGRSELAAFFLEDLLTPNS